MPEYLEPLDLVQVVGRWSVMSQGGLDSDGVGRAATGHVVFRPSQTVIIGPTKEIVVPASFQVALDAEGRISIMLPATNDPDVTPANWYYEVGEHIEGRILRSYHLTVDYAGGVVDLKTVAVPTEVPQIVILRSIRGVHGGVAPLDGDGDVTDAAGVKLYNAPAVDDLIAAAGGSLPAVGTQGQAIVSDGAAWTAAPISYAHPQNNPTAVWTVQHGLGYHPSVTVVDLSGDQLFGFRVTWSSVSTLVITWETPVSGIAYVS